MNFFSPYFEKIQIKNQQTDNFTMKNNPAKNNQKNMNNYNVIHSLSANKLLETYFLSVN